MQGILIHSGNGGAVARAGLVRLAFVAAALSIGYHLRLPGYWLAAIALMGGIIAEALSVTLSAKKLVSPEALEGTPKRPLPTTVRGVWSYYWPLANSMLVVWGGRALLVAIIARALDSSLALAAWPAAWGLVLLVANSTRMVQQVIIRNRHKVTDPDLIRFAASVGATATLILLLVSLTSFGTRMITAFVGYDTGLANSVIPVLRLCSVIPLLVALQNAIQGSLISEARTGRINAATWIGPGVLLATASLSIAMGVSGALAAALAMLASLAAESLWLAAGIPALRHQATRFFRKSSVTATAVAKY